MAVFAWPLDPSSSHQAILHLTCGAAPSPTCQTPTCVDHYTADTKLSPLRENTPPGMSVKVHGAAIALVLATLLLSGSGAEAQGRPQRPPGNPGNSPPRPPGPPRPRGPPEGSNPGLLRRCFVPNCGTCNNFNPYLCAQCNGGYQLTGGFSCNSCAPGNEQNLEVQTFTCSGCPAGTTSPGGTGQGSQCVPITATSARRLFGADSEEDLWA